MKLNSKLLDIIIPCYNNTIYLKHMLDSLNQYIIDKEKVNLIIIDDHSNYQLERKILLEQYSHLFDYKLLINESNLGPGSSRERGLLEAKSEFVTFMDDDDEIISDPLNYCVNNVDLISTSYNFRNKYTIKADSTVNPIYGIIYKLSYLQNINIHFAPIRKGSEDSLFRFVSLLCTNNIFYDTEKSFYKANNNMSSNFSGCTIILEPELQEHIGLGEYQALLWTYYADILKVNKDNLNYQILINFCEILKSFLFTFNLLSNSNYLIISVYYIYIYSLKLLLTYVLSSKFILYFDKYASADLKYLLGYLEHYIRLDDKYLYIKPMDKNILNNKYGISLILKGSQGFATDIFAIDINSINKWLIDYYYNIGISTSRQKTKPLNDLEVLFKTKW